MGKFKCLLLPFERTSWDADAGGGGGTGGGGAGSENVRGEKRGLEDVAGRDL